MRQVQVELLIAMLVVLTFATAPLSTLGQKVSPVAPSKAEVEAIVGAAYEKFKSDTSGKSADYIPFLAQVDSRMFGVAIVTTDLQGLYPVKYTRIKARTTRSRDQEA